MLVRLLALSLGYATLLAQFVNDPLNGVPYSTNAVLAAIDFDGDGQLDANYSLATIPRGGPTLVAIGFESDDYTSYLSSSKKVAAFAPGEAISSTNKPFKNSFGFFGFDMDDYEWENSFFLGSPHSRYGRFPDSGEFSTQTSALVGLRFFGGDNFYHHAWIRLTRPDNVAGTPFRVASYGYNPLPDELIQAGLPAPPPAVTSSMDVFNGGFIFSWAAKAAPYFKLQTRADLGPATEWTEVDTGEGHTYTAPPDSAQGYYRLIQR